MEVLKSKKLELPVVYFITDRKEIKDIPVGIPFIYGDEDKKKYIIRLLEYEVLYQSALATGFPFDFKKILADNGYDDITHHSGDGRDIGGSYAYIDYASDKDWEEFVFSESKKLEAGGDSLKDFIKNASAYVDIQVLKDLNVFPVWVSDIEEAVNTNIHNFATFNPNMYNKKLEAVMGGIEMTPPGKNLIIIDISGSIPRAVSATCLTLAKHLAETFYSDLMITGSKTTLYGYEDLPELKVEKLYSENKMDNDQEYFRKLVTGDTRNYDTAIVFGDNDHPGHDWRNEYNRNTKRISDEDGQKMCQWTVNKIISFHTKNDSSYYTHRDAKLAGYARWFKSDDIQHVMDWVKYLK